MVAWAVKPSEATCSRAPLLIVADTSKPKPRILAVPPLLMVVRRVVALASTSSVTPALTVAPVSVLPGPTSSTARPDALSCDIVPPSSSMVPPLKSVTLVTFAPDSRMAVAPAWTVQLELDGPRQCDPGLPGADC